MPLTPMKIATYIVLGLLVFAVLTYFGVQPFAGWGRSIVSAVSSISFDKITAPFAALIGSTGVSIGAASGLAYAYKVAKDKLKQTQATLFSTQQQAQTLTQSAQSLTQEKATWETQAKSISDKLAAEKQAALNEATQLKTQVSTMQQNYNSLDAQKAALQQQVADMKAASIKAQAQLDVLIPKVK